MRKRNIILIGFMAVGKTTIGKILSEKLGYHFIDTDRLIETREKMTIDYIFSHMGEKYFRQKEAEVVQQLEKCNNTVISTGGGIVTSSFNRKRLIEIGTVVQLVAKEEWIMRNLKNSNIPRPLLMEELDPLPRIKELLKERQSYYSIAHHRINVDHRTPEEIAEDIIAITVCNERKRQL